MTDILERMLDATADASGYELAEKISKGIDDPEFIAAAPRIGMKAAASVLLREMKKYADGPDGYGESDNAFIIAFAKANNINIED